jgi:hypothetical protein
MDIPELRRRVRAAIDEARRAAAGRRQRSDEAARAYESFLATRGVPLFHQLAAALTGEGHRFQVSSPAGSVRLAADGSPDDFIELTFDGSEDPPVVLGRVSRGRGRRAVTSERPVSPGKPIADLTESDVADFVLGEIGPLVER